MKLLVALGNPGEQYLKTRHNAGFLFLDHLIDHYGISDYQAKFKGAFTKGAIGNQNLFFLKPLTYMNLSGGSVQAACQFYKIAPEDVLVIHDDLDVSLGTIKVKQGGSSGGHNGIKSIEQCLGTPNFWRLRIGIDRPPLKEQVSDYVLSSFTNDEIGLLADLYDIMVDKFPLLLEDQTRESYSTVIKEKK